MKVILKQDVRGVGKKYEIKNVSDGYANNFLIPKKLVEYATADTIKKADILRVAAESEKEIREKLTVAQIEMLKGTKVVLKKKASEKGHLFEKIHPDEIVLALKEQVKIDMNPDFIDLETPIKEVGEHTVLAHAGNSRGEFKVLVEALS